MAEKTNSAIANLRAIAIIAIVMNHAKFGGSADAEYTFPYFMYAQLSKFGSVLFMIISGYLFQKTIYKYSLKDLLNRKTATILLPSLLFITPWIILSVFINPNFGPVRETVNTDYVLHQLYDIFFNSIYWFPINLFVIILVNSFMKDVKTIQKLFPLAVLITLFYSLNIYGGWVERKHNSAILGFFTFFFIGRLLYQYYPQVKTRIYRFFSSTAVSISFAVVLLLFFFLSVYESIVIQRLVPDTDANNILKISNIIYSLLFLVVLYLGRNLVSITHIFKDKCVFLIYLIHPYFLFIGSRLTYNLNARHDMQSAAQILPDFLYAIVLLVLSLLSARLLLANKTFNSFISGNLILKPRRKTLKTDIPHALDNKEALSPK